MFTIEYVLFAKLKGILISVELNRNMASRTLRGKFPPLCSPDFKANLLRGALRRM